MWKKVYGVPGSCSFWEYEDGRLALTSGGRHPDEAPEWVDVQRTARVDNATHTFEVPVICSATGNLKMVGCLWSFAPQIMRLTGLKVEVTHPAAWDEQGLVAYLKAIQEGRLGPSWTYRPERDPLRNEVSEIPSET